MGLPGASHRHLQRWGRPDIDWNLEKRSVEQYEQEALVSDSTWLFGGLEKLAGFRGVKFTRSDRARGANHRQRVQRFLELEAAFPGVSASVSWSWHPVGQTPYNHLRT